MRWSRLKQAAGVLAAAVAASVLVGPQPAHADITVDSAVCLNNATGTLTSPAPFIPNGFDNFAVLNWQTTTQTTFCAAANAKIYLVLNGRLSNPFPAVGSASTVDTGLYILRVRTSLGQKDLASLRVFPG